MVRRHSRKIKKFRGHSSYGKGNTKNKRGSGNKGGVGRGGMQKHRWTYAVKYNKGFYGAHGFNSQTKKQVDTINLWSINQDIQNNKLEKKGDKYEFSFSGKVLGCGFLSSPVIIKADSASKKAIEKIEKSGGEFQPTKK